MGFDIANFLNSDLGGLLQAGLGGVAGAFGTPSSSRQNGTTQTQQSGTTNTNFNDFLNSLINSLQNTSSAQNVSGQQAGQTSTAANLNPATQQLLQKLTQSYSSLANPSLQGYQAQQTQGINNNADLNSQAVNNIMASRGLSTSPVAGTAAAGVEANRIGQINSLNQSIPLLQNQQNLTNLGASSNFLNSIPGLLGSTSTNTGTTGSTTNAVSQQSGQQTTGTTQGGTGYQDQNTAGTSINKSTGSSSSGGGVGSAVGGFASVLASLFSDKRLKEDIKELPSKKAVDKIMALRPKEWTWKGGSELKDEGFLAQDIKKILPELVQKDPEGSGFYKVNYAGIIPELVSVVQSLVEARG